MLDDRIAAVVSFTVAATPYNTPEGVGFGSGDVGEGIALMIVI